MLASHPPYALSATSFRFAAVANLAGRAPIGGQREVALAAYVVARLADDVLPDHGLSRAIRAERAMHAKQWLATLALPPTIRPAFATVVDASSGETAGAARAVRGVIVVTAAFLDTPARLELERLERALIDSAQAVVK